MRLVPRPGADLTPSDTTPIAERPVSWDAASSLEAYRPLRDSGPDRGRNRQRGRERNRIRNDIRTQHLANLGVALFRRIESGDQLPDPSILRLETRNVVLET